MNVWEQIQHPCEYETLIKQFLDISSICEYNVFL